MRIFGDKICFSDCIKVRGKAECLVSTCADGLDPHCDSVSTQAGRPIPLTGLHALPSKDLWPSPWFRSAPGLIGKEKLILTMWCISSFSWLHHPWLHPLVIRYRLGHQASLFYLLPSMQLKGNKIQEVSLSSLCGLTQTESGLHLVHTQPGVNSKKQSQSDQDLPMSITASKDSGTCLPCTESEPLMGIAPWKQVRSSLRWGWRKAHPVSRCEMLNSISSIFMFSNERFGEEI